MFDLISTAHSTEWLSFPNLSIKYSYPNPNNQIVDCQVIPNRNCFALFNRTSNFELLRTVIQPDRNQIQRIKKGKADELSCGALSKLYGSELALGMNTGFVRLFSVQAGQFMPFKFRPNQTGNAVIGMDYSGNDEHLAVAYNVGDVSLFNLKAGVKTSVFNTAGSCTVVRFHPTRLEALAAGSFEGAITLFNIETKTKIFFEKYAHKAPAQDISMSPSSNDVFVSCGYDNNLNVYDIRRGLMMQQHDQSHPLSTISLSPCGQYCAAGNINGEVLTYDFRNLQQTLCMRRIHEYAVVRVAFISAEASGSHGVSGDGLHATSIESAKSKTGDSLSIGAASSPHGTGLHAVCANSKDANKSFDANNSWASLLQFRTHNNTSMNDSMMRRLSIESNATGIGLGIQPPIIREESMEELQEECSSIALSNEPLPKIAANDPPPKVPRIVESASDVPTYAQKTAILAALLEEHIVKSETKKILDESVAYKALAGCEELQSTYANTVESLFQTMRPSTSEIKELFDSSIQDNLSIIDAMQEGFESCIETLESNTLNMFNALNAEVEFIGQFNRLL